MEIFKTENLKIITYEVIEVFYEVNKHFLTLLSLKENLPVRL